MAMGKNETENLDW